MSAISGLGWLSLYGHSTIVNVARRRRAWARLVMVMRNNAEKRKDAFPRKHPSPRKDVSPSDVREPGILYITHWRRIKGVEPFPEVHNNIIIKRNTYLILLFTSVFKGMSNFIFTLNFSPEFYFILFNFARNNFLLYSLQTVIFLFDNGKKQFLGNLKGH